jgi:hypothetical protein
MTLMMRVAVGVLMAVAVAVAVGPVWVPAAPAPALAADKQCDDGQDNDGDGKVDYPDDPDCVSKDDDSEKPRQCGDGKDNDGDGRIDHPADAGCTSTEDDSESGEPRCVDGKDNDGDGKVDYPADPGCTSAEDKDEADPPPPSPTPAPSPAPSAAPAPAPPADGGRQTASPGLLSPFPVVRLKGRVLGRTTRVSRLLVTAPSGATVRVRCRGRGCPRGLLRRLAMGVPVRMHRAERRYRAGVTLEVFVSKAGAIGKYTRFHFRRAHAPSRIDGCVAPERAGIFPERASCG